MARVGRPPKGNNFVRPVNPFQNWQFYYDGKTQDGKRYKLINRDAVCMLADENRFKSLIREGKVYGCQYVHDSYVVDRAIPPCITCGCGASLYTARYMDVAKDKFTGKETLVKGMVYFNYRAAEDKIYMFNVECYRAYAAKKLGTSAANIILAYADGFEPSNRVLSANKINREALGIRCQHCGNYQRAYWSPPSYLGKTL